MNTDVKIEYHADDFALFPAQSERILRCHRAGMLNGVSVMPNSPYLDWCMSALKPYRGKVAVTVHLNLMEGRSVCAPEEVPLLADGQGVLRSSFGGLLLHSFLPDRNRYFQQLKRELRGQIHALLPYLPEGEPLRLDSHAHYHMIPVVFDAMMAVIREERLPVSYIRIPREHLGLYVRNWRKLSDFKPINLVKVLVLNALAFRNRRKYAGDLSKCRQAVFLGVFFSGSMYRENVAAILPDAVALARKRHWALEILAHPGGVFEPEDIQQLTNQSDITFLSSDARRREGTLYIREGAGVL